ncbi:Piwi domain-containing protein [Aliterella atlantica]|uniref:Protein argonaute n=1 Tax=Aliterella atlantica CENA595 TaxID=1618023 RepID=A0A0D8ZUC0_9CYAN|nr:Piwi domain-containing protein [Aliterella atlantica]KJH71992.1 stem cell self-renewal protein Piwi [Aliterella atlantica CENA595]
MTAIVSVAQESVHLSEIMPLSILSPLNLMCFRVTPEIDKELANRLGFRFSRKFPGVVVSWHEGYFWVLGTLGQQMPSPSEWRDAIAEIQEDLKADIGNRSYSIQWVRQPSVTPKVSAELAGQILKVNRSLPVTPIFSKNGVEVVRKADIWAETIELLDGLKPCLTLTIRSKIVSIVNLADFFEQHPYRQNPEQLLVGFKVQEIERGGNCTITEIVGTLGEQREELIELAQGSVSKAKLIEAPAEQPVVSVQFGKNKKQFRYPLAALRPCVTAETSERFQVKYGNLLKVAKIRDRERQTLIESNKKLAQAALASYGFKLERSINSREYPGLFWQPSTPLDQTPLLFGGNFKGIRGQVLVGLSQGGVYRRHEDYRDLSRSIRISALKLCDSSVGAFLEGTNGDSIKQRLKKYKFSSDVVNKKHLSVKDLNGAVLRAEVEKAVNELVIIPTDIVLVFLPQSDRNADDDEGGSLYQRIYSQLLRRGIASQVIYDDTLNNVNHKQILNQVIPGILAKLGNLPFVLAEPLKIADYFIGLDISRVAKKHLPGTLNACASIRLYGSQGEFIRYQLEDSLIEGEEVPQRLLETLLPETELRNKTVLIYRDGPFCGKEVDHLLEWAKAIEAKFILVECKKSGSPRLYNLNGKNITAPTQGLALKLSPQEAILVTTKVNDSVGLARPLRLIVHPRGHQVSIESVLETTLKLTLLHHGALREPRLPMPLFGSDRIAELRLKGIYPRSMLMGDRQFWL